MIDPFRKNPMIGSTLICLGGVLMVMCGYFYFDDIADKASSVTTMKVLAGIGYLLWVAGSVQLAQSRFSSSWAGFWCGLLLVPGLVILLTVVPTRSRQQIWQEANPGFTVRAQQRQYRDLKSLH